MYRKLYSSNYQQLNIRCTRRGGVYFEDVNGEKEMSIIYTDTKNYTSNDLKELF